MREFAAKRPSHIALVPPVYDAYMPRKRVLATSCGGVGRRLTANRESEESWVRSHCIART